MSNQALKGRGSRGGRLIEGILVFMGVMGFWPRSKAYKASGTADFEFENG
ncbi:hypothetical protein [Methylocella tundrae]|nr:hypothetical protein [Methylocella tundrae]